MRPFYAIVALAVAFKLWLTSEMRIIPIYAPHDASNFIEHARSLAAGAWFGHYDDVTLIKQPFFVFYLALVQQFGLPLTVAHVLGYGAACVAACLAVRPLIASPYALAGLFAVLFFNPIETDAAAWTAMRSQINPTLALFVFAFACGTYVRRNEPLARTAPWIAGLCASFAAFMLTREEAVWIVPMVALFAGPFMWHAWRRGPRAFIAATAALAAVPIVWLLACAGVMTTNASHYGWAVTTETLAPEFTGAYDALARLAPPGDNREYPVPKAARMAAYRVSPAARELQPVLEGPIGAAWARTGCRVLGACADIDAGWFIWAFRDAVQVAGHYATGADARAYYVRLATEIDDACARKAVACLPKAHTLSPPFTRADIGPLLGNFAAGAAFVSAMQELSMEPPQATPALDVQRDYAFVVGATAEGPGATTYTGWLAHPPLASLAVTGDDADAIASTIVFTSSPDLAHAIGVAIPPGDDGANARFEITTTCASDCALQLVETSGRRVRIPLAATPHTAVHAGAAIYFLESAVPAETHSYQYALEHRILVALAVLYRTLLPILTVAACLLWCGLAIASAVAKRRDRFDDLVAPAGALLGAASLIFLLAYISTVSFRAFYDEYAGAAFPLLLFAVYTIGAAAFRRYRTRTVNVAGVRSI